MTAEEAVSTDPQQRLLLEVAYESIENAGIPISQIAGTNTSCYVGAFMKDYQHISSHDPDDLPGYASTGHSSALLANRISWFFDLRGSSVTIDTGCSGSTVAFHMACESLRTGEAEIAIAGGVGAILSPDPMFSMVAFNFLSPDGRCHSFDARANGYARGEGFAALVLKPLAAALRAGDAVRAVVRGSAVNQDGRTPGITLPSSAAQRALIATAYRRARLDTAQTAFCEAHGTGTVAGDGAELRALAAGLVEVYREYLDEKSEIPDMDGGELLRDLSYTLINRRSVFSWRTAAVASSMDELRERLRTGSMKATRSLDNPKVAFVFSGQVAFKRLQVDQAYHSPQMKRIEGDYLDSIKDLTNQQRVAGKVKFFSTVRGTELRDLKILSSPAYWVQNLTSPVQFSYAIDALLLSPSSTRPSTFLEIGPHPVLQTYLNQASALLNSQDPPLHASLLHRHTPAKTTALAAAAALWSRGIAVDLPKISQTTTTTGARLLADLPPYPWNHARTYWHESRASRAYRFRAHPRLDLLGAPTPDSSAVDRRWRNIVRAAELPWARDHRVQGSVLYPAAGMVAMVIEAGRQVAGDQGRAADVVGYEISGVRIERAMVVPEGRGAGGLETVARLVPADGGEEGGWAFTIASRSGDEAWRVNCSGALVVRFREGDVRALAEWPALRERYRRADEAVAAADALAPSHLYEKCEKAGLQYGRTFRNITHIRASGNVATASVCVPDTAAVMLERFEFPHLVHPAALDALFQTVVLSAEDAMVPTSIGYLFVAADLPSGAGAEFRGFCQTERSGLRSTRGDIVMTDAERSGPKIVLQDVGFTSLEAAGAGDGAAQDVAKMRAKICSEYLWKPDVDLLTRGQLQNVLQDLTTSDEQLVAWIDLFGHSNPESSILEISNGGTEITKKVLEKLGDPKEATPRFTRFTWTSSDLGCFDGAKEELKRWEPYVSFEKLDVESELMEQGFKSGMFDLILIERDLLRGDDQEKLRQLLRVGGKAVIYENLRGVARDGKDDAATDADCVASGANLGEKRKVVVNGNGHGFDNKRLKGELAPVLGIFRSARSENSGLALHTLDLSTESEDRIEDTAGVIHRTFTAIFGSRTKTEEYELAERDGVIHVPRIVELKTMNAALLQKCGRAPPVPARLGSGASLELVVGQPGNLESLHFVQTEALAALLPEEVEVEVKANDVAFQDAVTAMGQSSSERKLLEETYGISGDHIFDKQLARLTAELKRVTKNRGVDVVISSADSNEQAQLLSCVADFGSFSFSELEPAFSAAFKDSSGSRNPSKTVLIANEDDVVPVLPQDEHVLKMNPEACYIIVGGFGGVGKSIAGYLVKNGARYLAIISRSGAASPEDRSFMEELKCKGANVRAYASDISQMDSLKTTLDRIEVEMPPIKGVINSAMALKDILFESMTHDDYQHTTAPKIQGSWNLHALLPATLDFFIMLSSVAGVAGTRGQAAYNSGNAFQVALCQHRRARGLAAVALDLTITVGVGYVADKDELMQTLKNLGVLTISEAELHALVATAVAGRAPPEVMVGISTGGLLQYNRIDEPMWSHDNRFAYIRALDVVPAPDAGAALLAAAPSLRVALPAVADLAEAAELVAEALVAKLAAALGMEVGDLDRGKPVSAYGVDSLVAVEVRNWVWREMMASVSVFELLSETPVGELAGEIAGRSGLVPEELREKGE
ncbi:putative polyketide synthase protein [Neofusicoccum parvum UCRNP2]|uniref:Putative polyketide synthase protein n=1 Tax=Botryosphaeria parva (strain UCR-NP2) TaxID=1287680 RepID=R1E960_BOTPV|nr:putative polyketide synthase protein [Neofusicoccum parvum UCRNP2]